MMRFVSRSNLGAKDNKLAKCGIDSCTMVGSQITAQTLDSGDNISLVSVHSVHPSPDTLTSEVMA